MLLQTRKYRLKLLKNTIKQKGHTVLVCMYINQSLLVKFKKPSRFRAMIQMDKTAGIFEIREYIGSDGKIEKHDVRDISKELEYFSKLCAADGAAGTELNVGFRVHFNSFPHDC